LGDYIDRGRDSKGVIDMIFNLHLNGVKVECLMGNHEIMLLDALKSGDALDKWFGSGGRKTLDSFGVYDLRDIPQRYMDFFESLKPYIEVDNYILVHAGLDFELDDPLSDKNRMAWIRYWYLDIDYSWLRNRIIVHGHTPTSLVEIQELHQEFIKNQYINIDAGCVFTDYATEGYGHLCAFNLTTRAITFHKNIDV
jgi:serine/threonine protein phosphatase 1